MYLEDNWYVAAWSDEVGRSLFPRTLLDRPVVMYRKQDGTVVALEDRCAHRKLPLSEGRLVDDRIECGYHGLVYDCSGTCVHVPGQARIPRRARTLSYPVVERDQFILIWMGDPERADPGKIVSFPRLSDPSWGCSKVRLYVKANYLLIFDNLLDLSHVAYVHNTTIGNAPVAEEAAIEIVRDGNDVSVTREMVDVPAAPNYAQFGPYQGQFDRWQVGKYIYPSYFYINNGCAAANSGNGDGARLETPGDWGFQVYHGITPETERTTHQFWVIAHDLEMIAARDRPEFYRQHHQVIGEDVVMYEAQQHSLDTDLAGATPYDVQSRAVIEADTGLSIARNIIKQLHEDFAARTQPADPA